jgi:hypothetical protein
MHSLRNNSCPSSAKVGRPVYSATISSVNKSNTNIEYNDIVSDESASIGSAAAIYLPYGILPYESRSGI